VDAQPLCLTVGVGSFHHPLSFVHFFCTFSDHFQLAIHPHYHCHSHHNTLDWSILPCTLSHSQQLESTFVGRKCRGCAISQKFDSAFFSPFYHLHVPVYYQEPPLEEDSQSFRFAVDERDLLGSARWPDDSRNRSSLGQTYQGRQCFLTTYPIPTDKSMKSDIER